MVSAITTAVGGFNNAVNQMNKDAQSIANLGNSTNAASADETQSLVGLNTSSLNAQADLKVINVQEQTTQSLLDIIA